jgi:hypothetical protein
LEWRFLVWGLLVGGLLEWRFLVWGLLVGRLLVGRLLVRGVLVGRVVVRRLVVGCRLEWGGLGLTPVCRDPLQYKFVL